MGGGQGALLKFDVSDPAEAENVITKWSEANTDEYIEVLVNNAGIRKDTLMVWMEDEDWNDVMNTNLNGFFFVTRAVLKRCLKKDMGVSLTLLLWQE